MFVIEDNKHSEQVGEYQTQAAALARLKELASLSWDTEPNRAPCTNWKNCGRSYEVVEYDNSVIPWSEIKRSAALTVDAAGASWEPEFTH